jgi:hypothetical protein
MTSTSNIVAVFFGGGSFLGGGAEGRGSVARKRKNNKIKQAVGLNRLAF